MVRCGPGIRGAAAKGPATFGLEEEEDLDRKPVGFDPGLIFLERASYRGQGGEGAERECRNTLPGERRLKLC